MYLVKYAKKNTENALGGLSKSKLICSLSNGEPVSIKRKGNVEKCLYNGQSFPYI